MTDSSTSSSLDRFILRPDVAERFSIRIRAPADRVLDIAAGIDLQSVPLVRTIFRMRERFMRATSPVSRQPQGLLAELRGLGWGILEEQPGRLIVCGAVCQPWVANVVFRSVSADNFAAYHEPDQVKIVWTLEAEPLGRALTRFSSETRAAATDPISRRKFARYWRWARFGIVAIRLLLLPAVRREAERQTQARTRM